VTEPGTRPPGISAPFWDAAREGRLLIQRSRRTGRYVYYPRAVSPFGTGDELEWVEVSGKGTVYAYAIARTPTVPEMAADVPYVIAIVELTEGARLTANIVGCDPETVHTGMPVEAAFVAAAGGRTLVQFRPAISG
jgi:hypothetical protein